MKNKGFSLIEVIIVITIIVILSTLIIPSLRVQLAKGKDTKAISTLSTLRLAAEIYQVENTEVLIEIADYDTDEKVKEALLKLKPYLNKGGGDYLETGEVAIGGSRKGTDTDVKYGGNIKFTFKNPKATGESDGVYIWFKLIDDEYLYDSRGEKWQDY